MTIYYNSEQQTKTFINALSRLLKEGNFYIDFSTGFLYQNGAYVGELQDDSTSLTLTDDDPYDGLKELYSVTHE